MGPRNRVLTFSKLEGQASKAALASHVLLAVMILLLVSSCSATDESIATEKSAFNVVSPCPFSASTEFDPSRLVCGYLSAPENRNDPASARLQIPVAIIKTASTTPKPDPVVFLHGGPGAAPLDASRVYSLFGRHLFGVDRDIIVYNQRGSHMVEPALDCGETLVGRIDAYADDLTLAQRDQKIAALAKSCLQKLMATGRDLRGYTAAENAADLRDLRISLGLEQWNLMAVSYGTLMALEATRIDDDGVRSMILDSLVSNESDLFMSEASRNFAQGVNRMLVACATDPVCAEAFPNLEQKLSSVLASLHEQPVTVTVNGAEDGTTNDIVVNWHDYLNLVHWMLYNSETLRLAPLLIHSTEAGDLSLLTQLMDTVFPAPKNQGKAASGAFFAIACNDQYRDRMEYPALAQNFDGFASTSFMEQVCGATEYGFSDRAPKPPTKTDIPTLLLSGNFDPMTPDIYAEQTKKNLSHAVLVRVPDFGHSTLSGYTACQTILAKAFLDKLAVSEEFSCVDKLSGPKFILSLAEAAQK